MAPGRDPRLRGPALRAAGRAHRSRAATTDRPLIAVDPDGEEQRVPRDTILAFGSERHGLSQALLADADARVRIPMRAGVSSLNLATSVAAVLYGLTEPWSTA